MATTQSVIGHITKITIAKGIAKIEVTAGKGNYPDDISRWDGLWGIIHSDEDPSRLPHREKLPIEEEAERRAREEAERRKYQLDQSRKFEGMNPVPEEAALPVYLPEDWPSGLMWLVGSDPAIQGQKDEIVGQCCYCDRALVGTDIYVVDDGEVVCLKCYRENEADFSEENRDEAEYPDPEETYSAHMLPQHFRDGLEWLIGRRSFTQKPSRVNEHGVLLDAEMISIQFPESLKARAEIRMALGPDMKWYFGEDLGYKHAGSGCAPSIGRYRGPGKDTRVEAILAGLASAREWFAGNDAPKSLMKCMDAEQAKWEVIRANDQTDDAIIPEEDIDACEGCEFRGWDEKLVTEEKDGYYCIAETCTKKNETEVSPGTRNAPSAADEEPPTAGNNGQVGQAAVPSDTNIRTFRIRNEDTNQFWEGEAETPEQACHKAGWMLMLCSVKEKTNNKAGGWKVPDELKKKTSTADVRFQP